MKAITSFVLVVLLATPLAGCLVTNGHHHRGNGNASARRGGNDCGPAHHWNGYKCEHNGRANGHRK